MSADFCLHVFKLGESPLTEADFRCFMENHIGSKYFYETFDVNCRNCGKFDYKEIQKDFEDMNMLIEQICPNCSHHVEIKLTQKSCKNSFCEHWRKICDPEIAKKFHVDETSWDSTFTLKNGEEIPNLCSFFGELVHSADGYPFHTIDDDFIKEVEDYRDQFDKGHYSLYALNQTIEFLYENKGSQVFSIVW